MDCIDQAQVRDKWRAHLDTIMDLRIHFIREVSLLALRLKFSERLSSKDWYKRC